MHVNIHYLSRVRIIKEYINRVILRGAQIQHSLPNTRQNALVEMPSQNTIADCRVLVLGESRGRAEDSSTDFFEVLSKGNYLMSVLYIYEHTKDIT